MVAGVSTRDLADIPCDDRRGWGGAAGGLYRQSQIDVSMLVVLTGVLLSVSWAGAKLWTTIPLLVIYGVVSWGLLAPQQHRLVNLAPQTAPVVLGLNTSCTYLGVTVAGVVGALGINSVGAHHLGFVGAVLVVIALAVAELATRQINLSAVSYPEGKLVSA